MDRRRPVPSPLPLLVAMLVLSVGAVLVSGCASRQSRDQYEQHLDAALKVRATVTRQLDRDELTSREEYEAAAQSVADALDRLDSDRPPRAFEPAHDRMVRGMEGLTVLLERLGRCEGLEDASERTSRACFRSIDQQVFDEIRNDFDEANTIYREKGLSVPMVGSDESGSGADDGDTLDGPDPQGGDE